MLCVCLQLHLKFCYEAVLKHAEQVLQRHGITTATCSRNTSSAASKVWLPQISIQVHVMMKLPHFGDL